MVKFTKSKRIQVVVGKGSNTEFKKWIKPSDLPKIKKHYRQYEDTVIKTGKSKMIRVIRIGK